MAVDNPTLILIPVGQPLGIEYRRDPLGRASGSSGPDAYFRVRLGKTVSRLTDEQFGAWMLAHGAPDAHGSVVIHAADHAAVADDKVDEPPAVVGALLGAVHDLLRVNAVYFDRAAAVPANGSTT